MTPQDNTSKEDFFSKWKKVDLPNKDAITDRSGQSWICLRYKIGEVISKSDALKDFEHDSLDLHLSQKVK